VIATLPDVEGAVIYHLDDKGVVRLEKVRGCRFAYCWHTTQSDVLCY